MTSDGLPESFANHRERDRIETLDGLRALAIALVLMGHVIMSIGMYARGNTALTVFGSRHVTWFLMNGWTGVDLFFVLSGFLIARQLLEIFAHPPAWHGVLLMKFARKRFFRIAPAYYLVALPSLLAMRAMHLTGEDSEWPFIILCYLFIAQDYFYQTLQMQYWSLAVEVQFYVLAPFIVMNIARLGESGQWIMLALILVILLLLRILVAATTPAATDEPLFLTNFRIPFHLSISPLMAGVTACFLWRNTRFKAMLEIPLGADIMFGAGALLFIILSGFVTPHYLYFLHPATFFSETWYFTLVSLAFAAMLLGLLGPCAAAGLFAARPLRIIAELSYSLYLVHLLFAKQAVEVAGRFLPSTADSTPLWCLSLIFLVAFAAPVAALIYVLVERPFNRWARKPTGAEKRLVGAG